VLFRGPSTPREPTFDDAGLAASGRRAKAIWTSESAAERDRLLALPPAARLAALDDDAVRSLLTAEHRAEVRASLAPALAEPPTKETREMEWQVERRRLMVLHTLRPVAVAGIVLAALLPFAVSAWRHGMDVGDVLVAFLAPGRGLLGLALALIAAAVLGRQVGKQASLEGLASLVVGAFVAGVAGLALGLVF
jgi:hypothetical protein